MTTSSFFFFTSVALLTWLFGYAVGYMTAQSNNRRWVLLHFISRHDKEEVLKVLYTQNGGSRADLGPT